MKLNPKHCADALRRLKDLYGEAQRPHSEQELLEAEHAVKQPRQPTPQQALPLKVAA